MRARGASALSRGLAVLCAACCACASSPEEAEDETGEGVVAPARSSELLDPWEPFNRGIFAFNEAADRWVLEPMATVWDAVLPEAVQRGIDRFFDNLAFPQRFANDLLQAKPRKAGEDLGRFLLNSTFGVAGLFDPAVTNGWLPRHDEDFGQTLGVWGVPSGPYLVLPLYGPSSPRDTLGLVADAHLAPERYFLPIYVSVGLTGTSLLNTRALALEDIRAERAAAFDFYAAVRRAYVQFRANQVRDAADEPAEDDDEDFFDLEDE